MAPNELIIRVQPDPAISLRVTNKAPGLAMDLARSDLDLTYARAFQAEIPDGTVQALKELRLQCKNEAEEVLSILAGLKELKKRNARGGGVDETLYTLRLRLESLHGNLDRILFTMMMARDTVLVDTWTGNR